jgi:hypothetical protein
MQFKCAVFIHIIDHNSNILLTISLGSYSGSTHNTNIKELLVQKESIVFTIVIFIITMADICKFIYANNASLKAYTIFIVVFTCTFVYVCICNNGTVLNQLIDWNNSKHSPYILIVYYPMKTLMVIKPFSYIITNWIMNIEWLCRII